VTETDQTSVVVDDVRQASRIESSRGHPISVAPTLVTPKATPFDGALLVAPRRSARTRVTLQLRNRPRHHGTRTFAIRAATRITTTICG